MVTVERMRALQHELMCEVEEHVDHLECLDAKELGEIVDMIKDISEAIYYETTIAAMQDKTAPITVMTK